MNYNGLDSDLKTFAKFVYIYENIIKSLNRESKFKDFSENAFYVFKNIRKSIKYLKMGEISKQEDFSQNTLFFTKSKTQVLDFCRHLRNAFCHSRIVKLKSTYISIKDVYRGQCSCIGYLEYNYVKQFVVELIKSYESEIKSNK